jgi:Ca2+-binding EF-hand superfamily protein
MRMRLAGVFSLALLWAGGSVPAQDEGELFGRLDTNKDGVVTSDEVPERQQALFERLLRNADRDGDKKLTKDEFQAGLRRDGLRGDDEPRPPEDRGPGFRGRGGDSPQARRGPPEGLGREQIEALFDRTDANSDGKLTKDEIPEERQGMRMVLERSGGDSITKEQFIRGMLAMAQGQPGRPGGPPDRRPEGAPDRRPDGPPRGGPFGPGLFAILDTDRDGELSTAEIVGAGTALLKLDRNGDGKLTPNEVGPGGPPPGPFARPGDGRPGQRGIGGGSPEAMRERLKQADANGDGKISKDEAPPMLRERFDRLDANSDGFIDEQEMRGMFERPRDGDRPQPGRRGGDRPRPAEGAGDNK